MTALVIIFAAIAGAVISVYLRQLSANKSEAAGDDALNSESTPFYDPLNPQTTILLEIEPDSSAVKPMQEVFSWGREAMAEYFYYGEIDSSAVKDDETGDLTNASFYAEVTVSFEEDAISVETTKLRHYRHHGFKTARFSIDKEMGYDNFASLKPADISPSDNTDDYENLITISDQDYSQFMVVGFAHNVCFHYVRIEAGRVTNISIVASDEFATMEWLFGRFNDLVARYKDLPMQKFTGAIRQ